MFNFSKAVLISIVDDSQSEVDDQKRLTYYFLAHLLFRELKWAIVVCALWTHLARPMSNGEKQKLNDWIT